MNMYRQLDRIEAIKNIQRMLMINETGVKNEAMIEAILEIQKENALEETGLVDYQTFTIIKELYEMNRIKRFVNTLDSTAEYPYTHGDYSKKISEYAMSLNKASSMYSIDYRIRNSNYYGDELGRLVLDLRRIYNLELINYIDEMLIYRVYCDNLMN